MEQLVSVLWLFYLIGEIKCMQPYKEGTRLKEILKDGWAKGFEPEQTRGEASLMGFYTTVASIELAWSKLDEEICKLS